MKTEIIEELSRITEEEQAFLLGRTEIEKERYVTGQKLVMDSGKLLERGKLISIRPHTRFVHFPAHRHNYVEMIYMCQGVTRHIVDEDEITLQQGELLILNQNAVQEIFPADKGDIAVNFIILPEFFDQTLEMMGEEENQLREFIIGCLKSHKTPLSYLHFQVADILPIQNLLENLVWTLLNRQPNKRSINQITMGLLFLQLMNYTDRVKVGEQHFEQEVLIRVYRYIEEHYRDGSLSELAEELHYDIYNLSRMIRRLTGKNYTELLQKKRLSQAVFLLEHTKLSVADIGERVGYENLSYFHRIFKERFGISPKQYRKGEGI
ncbi:MAG: AraC family transcriptional regulator [Fusicatenibacter sp.]|nr:AraC family transcriptional regulator [Lachnospiraceae bacterium]MDY2938821.1 AraC family transcriptional regulator [Fusicatenibacter sp.]